MALFKVPVVFNHNTVPINFRNSRLGITNLNTRIGSNSRFLDIDA